MYRDITIYMEGNELKTNKRLSKWINFTEHMIYLAWEQGRLYYFYDRINNEEGQGVQNFKLDDDEHSICFNWIGEWEDERNNDFKMLNVNYKFKVIIHKLNDFNEIKKIIKNKII